MIQLLARLRRPRWHYAVLALGMLVLVALFTPVILHTESALKISPNQQGLSLPDGFYLYQHLDERGIRIKSITPEADSLVVSLESPEQQKEAIEALQAILPKGYVIVLSESTKRHSWLPKFGGDTQKIG
ncbi:modulator protein [Yersinia entomophaga]|uniref:Modulator protein MzrA n=1 Tax=Yersinia entomophaga TaxID=935293 RepID=A0ABN4PTB1_YERET|nr:modulator protein [Yersinia entomophaga]